MKFKEYLKLINDFAKDHPESLELDCYTSIDDEGNGYYATHYGPHADQMDSDGEVYEGASETGLPNVVILN